MNTQLGPKKIFGSDVDVIPEPLKKPGAVMTIKAWSLAGSLMWIHGSLMWIKISI